MNNKKVKLVNLKISTVEDERINLNLEKLKIELRRIGIKIDRTKYILLVEREYGDEIARLIRFMIRTLDKEAVREYLSRKV